MIENNAEGIILKGIGGFYYVETCRGIIECHARGRFRKYKITPLIGDRVLISLSDDGTGYLSEILPRENELARPTVANLDCIVIVASEAAPVTDPYLIDRITAIAGYKGIEAIIAINKCDLDIGDNLFNIYNNAGFKVIRVSAENGQGIDELKKSIYGKISAFTGNSGVGKSSILNIIMPDFDLKIGDINEKIGRGKHTTRHVELFKLDEETLVADTPGFSSFDTERMDLVLKDDLQHSFKDFAPYINNCLFTGCSHVKDKGCAVVEAVNSGKIEKSRHESYVKLYESIKDIKEWEQK